MSGVPSLRKRPLNKSSGLGDVAQGGVDASAPQVPARVTGRLPLESLLGKRQRLLDHGAIGRRTAGSSRLASHSSRREGERDNGQQRSVVSLLKRLDDNEKGTTAVPQSGTTASRITLNVGVIDDEARADPEKERKKAKLAQYDLICSQILENVFLGSNTIAQDKDELLAHGITHILNCAGSACPNYFEDDSRFTYKTFYVNDAASVDISELFVEAIEFIDGAVQDGNTVFVHCHKGVSRSSSMTIVYIMWKFGWTYDEAYRFTRERRGVCNPNTGFICQLLDFQKLMKEGTGNKPRLYRVCEHADVLPKPLLWDSWQREVANNSNMSSGSINSSLNDSNGFGMSLEDVGGQEEEEEPVWDDPQKHFLVARQVHTLGLQALDPRFVFVLYTEDTVWVWVGRHSLNTHVQFAEKVAVPRLQRFFHAPDATMVNQGEEDSEFWAALGVTGTPSSLRIPRNSSYNAQDAPEALERLETASDASGLSTGRSMRSSGSVSPSVWAEDGAPSFSPPGSAHSHGVGQFRLSMPNMDGEASNNHSARSGEASSDRVTGRSTQSGDTSVGSINSMPALEASLHEYPSWEDLSNFDTDDLLPDGLYCLSTNRLAASVLEDTDITRMLYVWIGAEFAELHKLDAAVQAFQDANPQLCPAGHTAVSVVREGEEPEEFFDSFEYG